MNGVDLVSETSDTAISVDSRAKAGVDVDEEAASTESTTGSCDIG